MRKLTLMALLAAMTGPALAAGSGHTMQCWSDENGVRSCGDRVPPQYAQSQREVINSQGVVTSTKARKRTAAEVAADEKKAQDDAAERRRFNEQSAYDRYLLQTFQSVTQMQAVRDNRVQTLEGRLTLAEKGVAENEKTLQGLRDRSASRPGDNKLKQQVQDYETALVDTLKAVAQMKKDRDETNLKFERDATRYKKLRSGEIQVGSLPLPDPVMPAADAADAQPAAPKQP